MRNGVECTYVDSRGGEHYAVVESVTGTGPSGYKRVTLVFDNGGKDERREDVAHENDAEKGHVFWRESLTPRTELETGAPTLVALPAEPRPAPREAPATLPPAPARAPQE